MIKHLILLITLFSFNTSNYAQPYPKGLNKGENAPLFDGKDSKGNAISLKALLTKGDVVLIFYRGQWCPYCNKQLSNLNDSLSLIAKTKASFPVIADENLRIMKMYQVDFAVDQPTQDRYKKFGIDFSQANGTNGANLPVPATYVIDKNGKIKYVFFNPDYRLRPSVKDILEQL